MRNSTENNDLALQQMIEFMKQTYAFSELKIESELFKFKEVPEIYKPEPTIEDPDIPEFVYNIYDYGDRLIASKNDDYQNFSMYRMYMTIEKMVALMTNKIAEAIANIEPQPTEWIFALDGHEYCKRKIFEVIINHPDNWLIINYDPGQWGSVYLNSLKLLNQKNFDYPANSPRDVYRHLLGGTRPNRELKQ